MRISSRLGKPLTAMLLLSGICGHRYLQAQLTVHSPFAKQDVTIPDGGEARVIASQADAYRWSNGWKTPTIFVDKAGWYWVDALTDGQWQRDSVHFRLGKPCFQIPNAIVANSESANCISLGIDCEFDSLRFRVYDRWATLKYETSAPVECWSGMSDGQPLPAGVYTYVLEARVLNRPVRRTGTITMVR